MREIIAVKENKTMAETELKSVMEEIDKLAFDLYNLSEEERKLISTNLEDIKVTFEANDTETSQ